MRRDYRSVLGGGDLPQGEILPKAERLMRKAIMDKIDKVEKIFRRVAGLRRTMAPALHTTLHDMLPTCLITHAN